MKEIQDVIKHSLKIMLLGIFMYIVSFWIIPLGYKVFVFLFGIWVVDLEGCLIFISWISQGIIVAISMRKVRDWKIIFYWLMGDLLYCCLIAVYHPPGLYGIGVRGTLFSSEYTFETSMFDLMLALAQVVIIQVWVEMVVGISRLIKRWRISHNFEKLEKPNIKSGNSPYNLEKSNIKSNSFLVKCMLSVGITLLLFVVAFLKEYFFGFFDFWLEVGVFLLEIISIIAIWSNKHIRGYNIYLYILGTILFEIILLITIWSGHMGEIEREYLLAYHFEFDNMDVVSEFLSELVAAFAGAVIIVVLIRLVVGLYQLIKRHKSRNE
ncbi:MAG: hypothetical protein HDT30_14375 [Clostridiales bacterium]|nr:hypothetical protein [Clostridiales bacterium]